MPVPVIMETTNNEESVKKMGQSVLDSFTNLADETEKKRIDSGLTLLKHLLSKTTENEDEPVPKEVQYACSRLIRGLGSSRDTARKGYYAAFSVFLTHFTTFNITDILDIINKELELSKFNSKGEEGEVCFGRILAFGALIRSGHFLKASSKDQLSILSQMIDVSNRKSYLPQLTATFLLELIDESNDTIFAKVLWPGLQPWILRPFSEHTLDTFNLLLKVTKTFPKALKKTELKTILGGSTVVRLDSLADISNILLNIKGSWQQHPVYEAICKELGALPNVAVEFWHSHVDSQLLGPKSSRSKYSLAIELFRLLAVHLVDKEKLPQLLSQRLISVIRQRLVRLPAADDSCEEHRVEANAALAALVDALKSPGTSDSVKAHCLERIVTSARGEFGFDQITKSNVVHSITSSLKSEGLYHIGDLCHAVISGASHPGKGDDDESNDSLPSTWLNKDRMAAINLLANLSTHPSAEPEFRSNQILLLLEYAFFPPPGCTSLCPAAKDSLLRCLGATPAQQSTQPLVAMRNQLTEVVTFMNKKISSGYKPHKTSKEVIEAWKKMIVAIGKLKSILSNETTKKSENSSQKHLASVLSVLFMHLGVQLFMDPELAVDSLQELHVCVEKAGLTKQKPSAKTNSDELNWVDVVTDIFLSLLAQNSSMLRNIVSRVFQALCPLMTENALANLVNVLDCSSDRNPLSHRSEQQNESDDDASGEEEEEEDNDEETSEADSGEEEAEEDIPEEDTVSDRVRAAVRAALGESAEVSDTESIDVDNIDEEEGKRLDDALSQAFSALRKSGSAQRGNLTKKQLRDSKELVHFRARVLDLVDIYIQSEQSMHLTLGLISPLFMCLEACLKDVTQKPLEARLRSCLRKLSGVKKFANTEEVDVDMISTLLKTLIGKGDRTAAVFLDITNEVCAVSSFLVRCSQLLPDYDEKKSKQISQQYVEALKDFFEKRDNLLPPTFFTPVLKTVWTGNFKLWPYLVSAAFENSSVRPFRKTQALTLLREFAANDRLLAQEPQERTKLASKVSQSAAQILVSLAAEQTELKHRFLKELLQLLVVLCQHYKNEISWKELEAALIEYLRVSQPNTGKDIKKLLHKLQNVLEITESAIKTSEFKFIPPKPVVNGIKNKVNGQERKKKRKIEVDSSKNTGHVQEKKVKKQAKELRLNLMSDGLDTSMDFSNLQFDLDG